MSTNPEVGGMKQDDGKRSARSIAAPERVYYSKQQQSRRHGCCTDHPWRRPGGQLSGRGR